MNEIYGRGRIGDTLGDSPRQDRGCVLAQIEGSGRYGEHEEHDGDHLSWCTVNAPVTTLSS